MICIIFSLWSQRIAWWCARPLSKDKLVAFSNLLTSVNSLRDKLHFATFRRNLVESWICVGTFGAHNGLFSAFASHSSHNNNLSNINWLMNVENAAKCQHSCRQLVYVPGLVRWIQRVLSHIISFSSDYTRTWFLVAHIEDVFRSEIVCSHCSGGLNEAHTIEYVILIDDSAADDRSQVRTTSICIRKCSSASTGDQPGGINQIIYREIANKSMGVDKIIEIDLLSLDSWCHRMHALPPNHHSPAKREGNVYFFCDRRAVPLPLTHSKYLFMQINEQKNPISLFATENGSNLLRIYIGFDGSSSFHVFLASSHWGV